MQSRLQIKSGCHKCRKMRYNILQMTSGYKTSSRFMISKEQLNYMLIYSNYYKCFLKLIERSFAGVITWTSSLDHGPLTLVWTIDPSTSVSATEPGTSCLFRWAWNFKECCQKKGSSKVRRLAFLVKNLSIMIIMVELLRRFQNDISNFFQSSLRWRYTIDFFEAKSSERVYSVLAPIMMEFLKKRRFQNGQSKIRDFLNDSVQSWL